jgi:putative FmdB family regulatory protein
MPIYEYGCDSCGNTFEYMQSMSDDPKTVCESCGGDLRKLISATAFHLKGGGWYKDLYASNKPSAGGSESKSESSSSAEPSSKSEPSSKTDSSSKADSSSKSDAPKKASSDKAKDSK